MKIAILADFHIGYERFREDALRQASQALKAACESADLVIIAGDIFDYRHPKPEVMAEAIGLFRNCSPSLLGARVSGFEGKGRRYTDIPIIAIPGTHERRTDGEVDPVEVLGLAGMLINANQACVTVEKGGEKVVVYGFGGVAEERFRDSLARGVPGPVAGAFNVFMFHQSIYEYLPFSKDFLRLDELPEGFDLYVDGHIHSRVEAKVHGKDFLIPGSTVLTQLKDGEQESKGFYIYDTDKRSFSFVPIDSRRFVVLEVEIDGLDPSEINKGIESRIDGVLAKTGDRPIIRVMLKGKVKDGFKSIDIEVGGAAKKYAGKATIEISKGGVVGDEAKEAENLRSGMLENVSIRDYGLGVFVEKLREKRYSLGVSPSVLFDILSSDMKKDAVIKKGMEAVLDN